MSSEAKYWPNANAPRWRRGATTDETQKLLDEIASGLSAASTGMTQLREALASSDNPPPITNANVIRVRSGENLQKAIDQAATTTGTVEIRVEPGATFSGNYRLRARAPGAMVLFRPDFEDRNLPAINQWVTPDVKDLPKFKSANNLDPIFQTTIPPDGVPFDQPQSNSYAWLGCQFEPLAPDRTYLELGPAGAPGVPMAKLPRGFLFDRCWFRGDPVKGGHRAVGNNVNDFQMFGCRADQIAEIGRDAQCVGAYLGGGNHEIAYNYLEASGENLLYGGSFSGYADNIAYKIRVHHNYFTKDLAWQTRGGSQPSIKNLFELKNARDVIVEFNVLEHCWVYGQTGYAFVITPTVHKPKTGEGWVTVSDVIIRNNVVRYVGGLLNMNNGQGGGPYGETTDGVSLGTHNIRVEHNFVHDVNNDPRWKGAARTFAIGNASANADGPTGVVMNHNTFLRASVNGLLSLYGPGTPDAPGNGKMTGMEYTNNIAYDGDYDIIGGKTGIGLPTLNEFTGGQYKMAGNAIEKGERTGKFDATNVIVPAGTIAAEVTDNGTVKAGGALSAAKTTDGAMVGADVSKLPTFA
jgi:hypothetical protein